MRRSASRGLDHQETLALLGIKLGIQSQLRHAQDAVHGSTEFVADVGQELSFGASRSLGCLLGSHQLLLRAFAQANIVGDG